MNQTRLHYLDVIRGLAILLMIIYHFSFDLDNFNYIQINMDHSVFWQSFRAVIITLFLTTMGMCLALIHSNGIRWQSVKKRTLILGLASILVSIISYIQFPKTWIYFGIYTLFSSLHG